MIDTVIKVGGSLGQNRKLPDLLLHLSMLSRRHDFMLVPGGGVFADTVRDYDQQYGIDHDAAHWMAILAMDQYGHLLASMLANGTLVHGFSAARKAIANDQIPVLVTYGLLRKTDVFPKSWDVTSDSIAVWLANFVGAKQLVLLKSIDGIFNETQDVHAKAELLESVSLSETVHDGRVVDRAFTSMFNKTELTAWLVNGNHPERLDQLLNTGSTKGTLLLP